MKEFVVYCAIAGVLIVSAAVVLVRGRYALDRNDRVRR